MTYRLHDVAVDGGTLRVGEWGPDDPGGGDPDTRDSDCAAVPTVIGLHGVTASHLAWALVARELCGQVRLIAPDLRGRGRSAGLPGPYGMARHAADLVAVADALKLPPALLLGHSMGGFVAAVAAHLYPDRFGDVLLVDGGLPLAVPEEVSAQDLLEATLGPAMRRLSMTFPDRAAYLEFWKAHPAFATSQSTDGHSTDGQRTDGQRGDELRSLAEYASYDLTGTEPELRASASLEAVIQDSADLYGGTAARAALAELKLGRPAQGKTAQGKTVSLLTAPRGLFNEQPGIYSPGEIGRWRAELPAVTIREVPDVNHYTIVMGSAGAGAVAREVLRAVGAGHPSGGAAGQSRSGGPAVPVEVDLGRG